MLPIFEKYLNKYKSYQRIISAKPKPNLFIIVVIPIYNEPKVKNTLQSLFETKKTNNQVEVILLINQQEKTPNRIKQQNEETFQEITKWIAENKREDLRFFVLFADHLPEKHAGVGLARKIGMDEAVSRFNKIGQENGIIASLDADTIVSENYFKQIEQSFENSPFLNAVLPAFKHCLNDLDVCTKKAIVQYELYLRYFKIAMKSTGFPYAYHTIGSAFAVRASAYVKQGGMNKKQGGEDFYFLHKIFQLGHIKELTSTCVYPSGRVSDRVPFGTGPAVATIKKSGIYESYNPCLFFELKKLFDEIDTLFFIGNDEIYTIYNSLPERIKEFLDVRDFEKKIIEIKENSKSQSAFSKRFFSWFDAFKIIKYLNFCTQETKKIPIQIAIAKFFALMQYPQIRYKNDEELLDKLIEIEKNTNFFRKK